MGWVAGVYDSPRPSERHSLLMRKGAYQARRSRAELGTGWSLNKPLASGERGFLEKHCFNQLAF